MSTACEGTPVLWAGQRFRVAPPLSAWEPSSMRNLRRAGVLVVLALALSPAIADAAPYLGYGEASRALGKQLHRSFKYGATSGSLYTDCWRLAINRVNCHMSFNDDYGDPWCGVGRVRENWAYYSVGWNVGRC